MFKRLAPVIELPENQSECSSPMHKRSQTQLKSRAIISPLSSNSQVWQLIQSRRILDKKIRCMHSGVKSVRENSFSAASSVLDSPCNKSSFEMKTTQNFDKKKVSLQITNRLRRENNKENREKVAEKVTKARESIRLQSALDMEYIKKREEILIQQKKEKVSSIKSSLKNTSHKRAVSNNTVRRKPVLNDTKVVKRVIETKTQAVSRGTPRISTQSSEKKISNRSYSMIISPKSSRF